MKKAKKRKYFKINLPENFVAKSKEFDIFKQGTGREHYRCPNIFFCKNVNIANNGVVYRYFNIIRSSCSSIKVFFVYSSSCRFFLKYIFRQPVLSRKRIVSFFDEWSTNYYHWHIFALMKFIVLKNAGLIEGALVALPKRYLKIPFVIESLRLLGVKDEQFLFIRRKSHIRTRELAMVDSCQHDIVTLAELRRQVMEASVDDTDLGEKIYVSREGEALRHFVNEGDFVKVVKKYGFKVIKSQDYSYAQQVSIFSKAKYVIGAHGAGLTNVLFIKDGGSLFELASRSKDGSDKMVTDFYKMASIRGLKYFYQECQPYGEVASTQEQQRGLVVDLVKFEASLKNMLL